MRKLVSKSPQHYFNDLGMTKQPWNDKRALERACV